MSGDYIKCAQNGCHIPEGEENQCHYCDESFCGDCWGDHDLQECKQIALESEHEFNPFDPYEDDRSMFADPGGNSALRAATLSNPRNLPCPNCGGENLLTPADRAQGYQCNGCADALEGGFAY